MRTIPAPLQTKLDTGIVTLATCWKLILLNTQILGFTDHDKDLIVDGVTYFAATGIAPTSLETRSDMSVDNLEIETILDSEAITEADLVAGEFDEALVEIFLVDWTDTALGIIELKSGVLGEVEIKEGLAHAEIRGLTQYLQQNLVEVHTGNCGTDLGSGKCKINLHRLSLTGTATALVSTAPKAQFIDSTLIHRRDTIIEGATLTWTGGSNNTETRTISEFNPYLGKITLSSDNTNDISITDPYDIRYNGAVSTIITQDTKAVTCTGETTQFAVNAFIGLPEALFVEATLTWTSGPNNTETHTIIEFLSATGEITLDDPPTSDITVADTFDITLTTNTRYYFGTVTAQVPSYNLVKFKDTGMTSYDTNTFKYGLLTWLTGTNAGRAMEVKAFTKTGDPLVTLFEPMPDTIDVSDTFMVYIGCNKFFTTCNTKFINTINFRGFPHIPGQDEVLLFGGQ